MPTILRNIIANPAGFASLVLAFITLSFLIDRVTDIGALPLHSSALYTPMSLTVNLVRLLASVAVGGFVAALPGRGRVLTLTALLGCLMILFALFDGLPPGSAQPGWYTILTLCLLVPAAVSGGRLRQRLSSPE